MSICMSVCLLFKKTFSTYEKQSWNPQYKIDEKADNKYIAYLGEHFDPWTCINNDSYNVNNERKDKAQYIDISFSLDFF